METVSNKVNENGKLVFQPQEWRNKKISSFFSRMASAQRIRNLQVVTFNGIQADEADADICEALIKVQ